MSSDQRLSRESGRGGRQLVPGLLLAVVGVLVAFGFHLVLPAVGVLTAAVVLGVLVRNAGLVPVSAGPGLTVAAKRVLRVGVVLLGLQLALPEVLRLGAGTLLAVVVTVTVGFLGTVALARLLGVGRGLGLLVATGFSICGASAIAAVEGVVRREDEEVATAVALVTLYGSLAILAVPLLGPPLGLSGVELGAWAGLGVHEVAQVVAAASPAGAAAVTTATLVKLSRVVLLAPVVAAVGLVERRREPAGSSGRAPLVPPFVLAFLVMVGLRAAGVVPDALLELAEGLTTLLLAAALFALGTGVRVRALVRAGGRAVVLGFLSTLLIAGTAYLMVRFVV
nr:putative sulfate exporter family transporter [Actinoalloteichus caeruleus]